MTVLFLLILLFLLFPSSSSYSAFSSATRCAVFHPRQYLKIVDTTVYNAHLHFKQMPAVCESTMRVYILAKGFTTCAPSLSPPTRRPGRDCPRAPLFPLCGCSSPPATPCGPTKANHRYAWVRLCVFVCLCECECMCMCLAAKTYIHTDRQAPKQTHVPSLGLLSPRISARLSQRLTSPLSCPLFSPPLRSPARLSQCGPVESEAAIRRILYTS